MHYRAVTVGHLNSFGITIPYKKSAEHNTANILTEQMFTTCSFSLPVLIADSLSGGEEDGA